MSCTCKKKCTGTNCSCVEYDLLCTDLCSCTSCSNVQELETYIESRGSDDEADYDDSESNDEDDDYNL